MTDMTMGLQLPQSHKQSMKSSQDQGQNPQHQYSTILSSEKQAPTMQQTKPPQATLKCHTNTIVGLSCQQ